VGASGSHDRTLSVYDTCRFEIIDGHSPRCGEHRLRATLGVLETGAETHALNPSGAHSDAAKEVQFGLQISSDPAPTYCARDWGTDVSLPRGSRKPWNGKWQSC
jgi:hypothetical protein